eukprot:NODE_217_length_12479_cov_0.651212.p8 type:complete len:208 gc:universal NODE_217_length_12479_cov_0.651212:11637-12260(+)
MIAIGSIFLGLFFYSLRLPKEIPSHIFDKSFRKENSKTNFNLSPTLKLLENSQYNYTLNTLEGMTHYLFIKKPSLVCIKSVESLLLKLPPCSIYTNIHFNSMPREYYKRLFKEMPYLDYVFSTSFTIIDNCIVEQIKSANLKQFSFSFLHHLSLYSTVLDWNIYNDQNYLAKVNSKDICNYYIYRYPSEEMNIEDSTQINVKLVRYQ